MSLHCSKAAAFHESVFFLLAKIKCLKKQSKSHKGKYIIYQSLCDISKQVKIRKQWKALHAVQLVIIPLIGTRHVCLILFLWGLRSKKLWNGSHCRAPANYTLTVVGPVRINMLPACSRSTSRLLSGEEELHFHCLHYPSYETLIVGHPLLSFSPPTASEWVHSMGVENNRWGTVGNIVCKAPWGMVFIKKPHMHIPLYGKNCDIKRKICDSAWEVIESSCQGFNGAKYEIMIVWNSPGWNKESRIHFHIK